MQPITTAEAHELERVASANYGPCSGQASEHNVDASLTTCKVCSFLWHHAIGQVHFRRDRERLIREEHGGPPPGRLPW